jgi:hypothetical protein
MAAHRYWQLYCTANNGDAGGYMAIGEMYLATERSGADVTSPSTTITASSTGFGAVAANAINNTRTDYFHSSNTGFPHTLTIDFGAGNDQDIGEIRILPRPGQVSTSPKDFKLRSSDDNATWTDEITVTGYTGWVSGIASAWQTAGCPAGAAGALFWRWNFTDADAFNAIGGREAEMHTSIGGADVITSTTDFFNASSTSGGTAPANLFDNNTSTIWSSSGTDIVTLEIECSQKRDIQEVSWTARTDGGFQTQAPKDFTIDYSYDRQNWTAQISVVGSSGWASGETRTFSGVASSAWVPRAILVL